MKTDDNFIIQPLGLELMVYDKNQDKVHVLNETATMILQSHQKGHSPVEIALNIKKHFSLGDEQNISRDIFNTLVQMKSLYLV